MPTHLSVADLSALQGMKLEAPWPVHASTYSMLADLPTKSNMVQVLAKVPPPTPVSEATVIYGKGRSYHGAQWFDYFDDTGYDPMPIDGYMTMAGLGALSGHERVALAKLPMPIVQIIKEEIGDPETMEVVKRALRSPDPRMAIALELREAIQDELHPDPFVSGLGRSFKKAFKKIRRKVKKVAEKTLSKYGAIVAVAAALIPGVGLAVSAGIAAATAAAKLKQEKEAAKAAKKMAKEEQARVDAEIKAEESRAKAEMLGIYKQHEGYFNTFGMTLAQFEALTLDAMSAFFERVRAGLPPSEKPAPPTPAVQERPATGLAPGATFQTAMPSTPPPGAMISREAQAIVSARPPAPPLPSVSPDIAPVEKKDGIPGWAIPAASAGVLAILAATGVF